MVNLKESALAKQLTEDHKDFETNVAQRHGFIKDAYQHAFHEGSVKAAKAKGLKVKSFEDLTSEQLRELNPEIVEHAITHLDKAVMEYFLDKPQFNADTESQEMFKDSMYKVLFGNDAIVGEGDQKRKIDMGRDYFKSLFSQSLSQVEGKNLTLSHLEAGLQKSGVSNAIDTQSLYKFGKGLKFEEHRDAFKEYIGTDIMAVERITSQGAFDNLVRSYGRMRAGAGNNYDDGQRKQLTDLLRKQSPDLIGDKDFEREFDTTKKLDGNLYN